MANPVYDNFATVTGTSVATVTVPAFVVSGTDRLLVVTVGSSKGPTANSTTSVVRDSGGLNESCVEAWDLVDNAFHSSGHYRVAPATGSYAILVTLSNLDDEVGACATSWTGAHQTTPVGTPVTGSSNGTTANPTLTVSDASDEDLVIDGVHVYDASIAAGGDQTERANLVIAAGVVHGCSTQLGSVAGGVMSWTGGSNLYWAAGAMAIKPSVSTPVVPPKPVMAAQQRMG
jgi:hypothetical protein